MQCALLVKASGAQLSQPGCPTPDWHRVEVPTTVLSALVKNGLYPDPRIGLNAFRIPDSSDEFNAEHDLARFSHLPESRNPWREPYWFRKEVVLPPAATGGRVWLNLDAINYRAEVWFNGRRIAAKEQLAGMFQRFRLDVTAAARPGPNAIAIEIFPVDHPGKPSTMLQPLGPDRPYQTQLMRDVTEVVSVGYDCMMPVPDRNMGLWQKVWLDFTGPVDIRDPFVATELPLPETNGAVLRISTELVNASPLRLKGFLRGAVQGTDVKFEQAVELGPNESRVVSVAPSPVLRHPRLWWPRNYGEQHLYELELKFDSPGAGPSGRASDTERVRFGVRQLGSEIHERDGWQGRRVLVNGRRILCRGGYIQPELLFDWDARRMETELRYYAGENLNLIYFEDIPNPPEPFLELCDRYGILFGHCAYSCYWIRPETSYPDDFALLERCTVDCIKRYRNHPSLLFYMAMNEEDTRKDVYEMWRRHVTGLDGTRWFIPSAYFPSDRKEMGEWFRKDLPAGMTDKGASYSWAEPEQYFQWVREGRNWMFMMEGGSASLPPISSLAKFLPELADRSKPKGSLFPLDADWAHHGANHYYQRFDEALRRVHGEPESLVDYCWKAHLLTADQHRSLFEAVNHRVWDITSGMTQWKINTCEPTVQWQTFDYWLKPMVSWYFIKRACEPLHVQLNLPEQVVSVINLGAVPQPGLHVSARAFDLNARLLWERSASLEARADGFTETFAVPEPAGATPVYFVKLELRDELGRLLSDNLYWRRAAGVQDYKALQNLPPVKLNKPFRVDYRDDETVVRAKLTNPTKHIAFFIQLAVTDGRLGGELLPVLWDDNYFSLLPGETREVHAHIPRWVPARGKPQLSIGGWNVISDFDVQDLKVTPSQLKAGEIGRASAKISNTFLDGARIPVFIDGKLQSCPWAWARARQTAELSFPLKIAEPGLHELTIGKCSLGLRVQ